MFLGAAKAVDLASYWGSLWSTLSTTLGSKTTTLLGVIGLILLIGGVLTYLWERRKGGGGQGHTKLLWTMLIAGILAAPNFIIPVILFILDAIINAIIGIAGL
jgi:hypothetical protein